MQTITTIGVDIAKSVFQVHGVDAEGKVIVRRQLKRRYVNGGGSVMQLQVTGRCTRAAAGNAWDDGANGKSISSATINGRLVRTPVPISTPETFIASAAELRAHGSNRDHGHSS